MIHSLVAFAFVLSPTSGPVHVTVADLLNKAASFDTKKVECRGTVDGFQQRTSRVGHPYFIFKLKDKNRSVNVYGQGSLPKALGDTEWVDVVGNFSKEHKVGNLIFKLEIDTQPKDVKLLPTLRKNSHPQ